MKLSDKEILNRLGAGASIATICGEAAISREEFDGWWQRQIAARVPAFAGTRREGVRQPVRIERDPKGIPHIFAANDEDLFFAFGYAMAQDRLWQLDYLRRRGSGRFAEIVGADGKELDLMARVVGIQNIFELDLLARTVGLRRIAEAEWPRLPAETRSLLTAFSNGINAVIQESNDRLPIEFDLLDYRPEPWSPIDCLTIEVEFRWYLTGRFPVIVMPELVKRVLGDGPLYRAFLTAENDDESILPAGSYPARRGGSAPTGGGDGEGTGSNNWVVAGSRTPTGKPLVASDPHIPFDAVSWWYQVRLCGGSFHVAGAAYVGIPAVLFGRNEHVAWGCTNNICSQRDLYLEQTDPAHPGCFLYDGRWEPGQEREEVIGVRGGVPVRCTICSSRNGPMVSEVLPPAARHLGPVSLKWLGQTEGGWLTALLDMDRAKSVAAFREATRPWHVPTFCLVFADADGHIGFQATGRIPVRRISERGFRPGWDPAHQWDGLIPFEEMPHWIDPPRGWIATANNRVAFDDYPYPLSGTWSDGLRAGRIREMIEQQGTFAVADFARMHRDAKSMRAVRALPHLLRELAGAADARVQDAVRHLRSWDGRMEPDRTGATLFAVFFSTWTKAVVRQRFEGNVAALLAGGVNGLSAALLESDPAGWFPAGQRQPAILAAMTATLNYLAERLGPDMSQWTWDRVHRMPLRHVLSGRGDLAALLDHGGLAVPGDMATVCNTGLGGAFEARSGANYRLIADLASAPPALWAVDASAHSGNPGSAHYADQMVDWAAGRYHALVLDGTGDCGQAAQRLVLEPRS